MVLICWQRTVGEGPCSATEGEERARENRAREQRPEEAGGRQGGPGSWLDVGYSTSCARPGHRGSGQKRPMAGEGGPVAGWTLVASFARPGGRGSGQKRPMAGGSSFMDGDGGRRERDGGGAEEERLGRAARAPGQRKRGRRESGGRRGAAGSDARSPPVPSPSQRAGPSGEEREGVMGHGSQCIGGPVPPSCDPN